MPRIAISGTIGQGKTEFVDNFCKQWPNFKKGKFNIQRYVDKNNIKDTPEDQKKMLNALIDKLTDTSKADNLIFDGSVLDILAYIMRLANYNPKDFDDLYMHQIMQIVRQSLHFYDVIYYVPLTKKYDITNTEVDISIKEELDNLFKAFQVTYVKGLEWLFPFSEPGGSPALIELFGTQDERIEMMKLYINPEGTFYGKEDSLISDAISTK